jgi:hypothetical protein
MIEGAHEALLVICAQLRRRQIAVRGVSADMIADDRHATGAQGWQMTPVEDIPVASLAANIDIRCRDITVTDDHDRILMQSNWIHTHSLHILHETCAGTARAKGWSARRSITGSGDRLAAFDHQSDASRILQLSDVGQRIAVEQQQIGSLTCFD